MNRHLSVRLPGLLLLALGTAVAALALRRPALVALAVAFAAVPALGLVTWRWPRIELAVGLSARRVVEGDVLDIVVEVGSDVDLAWVDVEVEPAPGLRSTDGVLRRIVTVPAGGARIVRFPVEATAWGMAPVGRVRIVARDRFGLFATSTIRSSPDVVRVYPTETRLAGIAAPARTTRALGAHLAATRGDGCEYADVRTWQPGDRRRDINWRVSARRGATWVTERHPERAADVVLLLDDTGAIGPPDDSTLRRAIRAAMALAEGHLGVQDRVGLVAIGAPLRWMRPRAGTRQLYLLVDTLLDRRIARLSGVPASQPLTLPGVVAGTTVIALTSLAEARIVEVLADLARHGHHVIAVEPLPPAPDRAAGGGRPRSTDLLAARLWAQERAARRQRLRERGVTVLRWDGEVPLGRLLSGTPVRRP